MANPNPQNQFVKGQSGNKNGRPPKGHSMKEIFERYGSSTAPKSRKTRNELVVDALFQLAYEQKDIQAIKYVLDRSLGKPRETVDTNLNIEMPKVIEFTTDITELDESEYKVIDEDLPSTNTE